MPDIPKYKVLTKRSTLEIEYITGEQNEKELLEIQKNKIKY